MQEKKIAELENIIDRKDAEIFRLNKEIEQLKEATNSAKELENKLKKYIWSG